MTLSAIKEALIRDPLQYDKLCDSPENQALVTEVFKECLDKWISKLPAPFPSLLEGHVCFFHGATPKERLAYIEMDPSIAWYVKSAAFSLHARERFMQEREADHRKGLEQLASCIPDQHPDPDQMPKWIDANASSVTHFSAYGLIPTPQELTKFKNLHPKTLERLTRQLRDYPPSQETMIAFIEEDFLSDLFPNFFEQACARGYLSVITALCGKTPLSKQNLEQGLRTAIAYNRVHIVKALLPFLSTEQLNALFQNGSKQVITELLRSERADELDPNRSLIKAAEYRMEDIVAKLLANVDPKNPFPASVIAAAYVSDGNVSDYMLIGHELKLAKAHLSDLVAAYEHAEGNTAARMEIIFGVLGDKFTRMTLRHFQGKALAYIQLRELAKVLNPSIPDNLGQIRTWLDAHASVITHIGPARTVPIVKELAKFKNLDEDIRRILKERLMSDPPCASTMMAFIEEDFLSDLFPHFFECACSRGDLCVATALAGKVSPEEGFNAAVVKRHTAVVEASLPFVDENCYQRCFTTFTNSEEIYHALTEDPRFEGLTTEQLNGVLAQNELIPGRALLRSKRAAELDAHLSLIQATQCDMPEIVKAIIAREDPLPIEVVAAALQKGIEQHSSASFVLLEHELKKTSLAEEDFPPHDLSAQDHHRFFAKALFLAYLRADKDTAIRIARVQNILADASPKAFRSSFNGAAVLTKRVEAVAFFMNHPRFAEAVKEMFSMWAAQFLTLPKTPTVEMVQIWLPYFSTWDSVSLNVLLHKALEMDNKEIADAILNHETAAIYLDFDLCFMKEHSQHPSIAKVISLRAEFNAALEQNDCPKMLAMLPNAHQLHISTLRKAYSVASEQKNTAMLDAFAALGAVKQ